MLQSPLIVICGIIQKEGQILLAQRNQQKHLAGYWEFPGGKLEENETEEECLKREIKEELGVEIIVDSFLMENRHDYGSKEILLKSYLCQLVNNIDIILTDHDRVEWVAISDLISYNLAPADIPIVKALKNE